MQERGQGKERKEVSFLTPLSDLFSKAPNVGFGKPRKQEFNSMEDQGLISHPLLSFMTHKNDSICVGHRGEQTTSGGWTGPTFWHTHWHLQHTLRGISVIVCGEQCAAIIAIHLNSRDKPSCDSLFYLGLPII